MLVNLKEILEIAERDNIAIGMFNATGFDSLQAVIAAAEELMARGAQNVLVSLGGDGALLCTEDGRRLYQPAPDGTVIGTVGAGDSTVAGFVAGWHRHGDVVEALRLGVACGSATAFSEGLADQAAIAAVLATMPEMIKV